MEAMGTAQLRARIAGGAWPSHLMGTADRWLKVKNDEEASRRQAYQAEQIAIAREAKDAAVFASLTAERAAAAAERQADAAERANRGAVIALIIASFSIIETIVNVVVVHKDAVYSDTNIPVGNAK
jgi:hypothetical protein